jgi:predicted mannosyl-3-phosphoglycerate phosphatase (HAD superfamily)
MFIQLSRFAMYLISDEEKKTKKFWRGLNTCIWTMMTCFDIYNFSQLVDCASIYEESLKENGVEFVDKKRRTHGLGSSSGGARLIKRMTMGRYLL